MAGALGAIDIGDIMPVLKAALKAAPVDNTQPDQAAAAPTAAGTAAPAPGSTTPAAGVMGSITDARPNTPNPILKNAPADNTDKASETKAQHDAGDGKMSDAQKMYHEHIQEMKDDERRIDYLAHTGMLSPGQYESQKGMLEKEKADYAISNPWGSPGNHPGVLGKIAHVLSIVGQAGAAALLPGGAAIESMIPGSQFDLQAKQEGALGSINAGADAQSKEAGANAKDNKADEWEAHGEPFLMDGQLVQEQTNKAGAARTVPVAGGQSTPSVATPGATPAPAQGGVLGSITPQQGGGALGSIPAAPTHTISKLGEKTPEEDKPAEASAIQDVNAALQSPYLTPEQQKTMAFPEGAKPTKGEVKERLARIDRMNEYARQGKQDQFNNEMKKIAAQTTQQLAQLNIQEKQQKLQQGVDAKTQASNSDYYNLYDQDQYHDDVKAWHASGSFGKDSGLVNSKLNPDHGSSGGGGGLGLGLIAKTPATMIGAMGIETVMSQASSVLEGYKQAAISAGISTEGQNAIQAYTQAVLSRIQFDMTHMGAKASTMRMRELMRLAVQNVPPPDLQEKDFDSRFQEYRARMEAPIKANTPKGFAPPANPYEGVNQQRKQEEEDESKARGGAPKGSNVVDDVSWFAHHTPGIPDFPKDAKGLVQDHNSGNMGGYIGYLDKNGQYVPFKK